MVLPLLCRLRVGKSARAVEAICRSSVFELLEAVRAVVLLCDVAMPSDVVCFVRFHLRSSIVKLLTVFDSACFCSFVREIGNACLESTRALTVQIPWTLSRSRQCVRSLIVSSWANPAKMFTEVMLGQMYCREFIDCLHLEISKHQMQQKSSKRLEE